MDVNPGEFVGVIGPNGSGKSTLLKILGGVLTTNSSKLFFKGKDFLDYNRKQLARSITWIPQEHPMVFPFKVSEVVQRSRKIIPSLVLFTIVSAIYNRKTHW